jgi:hypothetical protein
MVSWKEIHVGRTAFHGEMLGLGERQRSAARRPWTVMGLRAEDREAGTVSTVRRADFGTVTRTESACSCVSREV